jgi:hypothetical protein
LGGGKEQLCCPENPAMIRSTNVVYFNVATPAGTREREEEESES